MKEPAVTTGKMLISDVLRNIVGTMPMERRLSILMEVINKDRTKPYTGVKHTDGTLYGSAGNVIEWNEFVNTQVTVGNINI